MIAYYVIFRLKCKTHILRFIKIYFNLLTFKFIRLRLFYQLLLCVVINFSIFQIFLQNFLIKKIQLMIEKYFNFFFKKFDENALIK